jgi:hypothetical protein
MPAKTMSGTLAATARSASGSPEAAATRTTPIISKTPVHLGITLITLNPNAIPPATMMAPCTVIHGPKAFVRAAQSAVLAMRA